MNKQKDLIKLFIELDEDWHGFSTESVWVKKLGNDLYRIENTPFYAMGISFQDIVKGRESNGRIEFQSVVERGGHSTYRIFVNHMKISQAEFERNWSSLKNSGCSYEEGSQFEDSGHELQLYAIDVPPGADCNKIKSLLEEGEKKEVWEYEEGCIDL